MYDVNEMTFFFVENHTVEIGQDERANEGRLRDLPGRRRARRSCAFECALPDLCEGESLEDEICQRSGEMLEECAKDRTGC